MPVFVYWGLVFELIAKYPTSAYKQIQGLVTGFYSKASGLYPGLAGKVFYVTI